MMMGERVAVLRRREVGRDSMGEPVWSWDSETVDGVLVRPSSPSDQIDALRPDGVAVEYTLAFPKSYTSGAEPLRHARVALVDRGMDPADHEAALHLSGSPDVVRPCPTSWDMLAEAGRSYG